LRVPITNGAYFSEIKNFYVCFTKVLELINVANYAL